MIRLGHTAQNSIHADLVNKTTSRGLKSESKKYRQNSKSLSIIHVNFLCLSSSALITDTSGSLTSHSCTTVENNQIHLLGLQRIKSLIYDWAIRSPVSKFKNGM